jgi:hypothetical protein
MRFLDIAPARDEIQNAVGKALQSSQCGIFVDSSVLTHCYEISAGARAELLDVLGKLGAGVRIPLWAAHETWNNGNNKEVEYPLKALSQRVANELDQFLKDALRFLDDEVGTDENALSRKEFEQQLRTVTGDVKQLTGRVVDKSRKPETTSESLLPFINDRMIESNIDAIFARVTSEGAFRYSHKIPPGDGDAGKGENKYGDLIIWFEILEHAKRSGLEDIVLITRDLSKGDWVYKPRRVLDENRMPTPNNTITLPLPFLVHEARSWCPTVKRIHIISLEEFVRVMGAKLQLPLPKLAIALQTEDEQQTTKRRRTGGNKAERVTTPLSEEPESKGGPTPLLATEPMLFSSSDLLYELNSEDELDLLILALREEDWEGQNSAAQSLDSHLEGATRGQCIQLGIALAMAANSLALEPLEFLARLFDSPRSELIKQQVLLGVLVEVYLTGAGDLKKPSAVTALTQLVFECGAKTGLAEVEQSVMSRLEGQVRRYLALPNEPPRTIELVISAGLTGNRTELASITADGIELLEQDAPPSRHLPKAGSSITVSAEELIEMLSNEFVVPVERFALAQAMDEQILIPDRMGFVAWGPSTGLELRNES